ncbi:G2/mitotic-specific cyclin-B3 [Daktulosphaira vitifoliae]|uniref:G2/mitotic-specific cyclin-B3 n=1 Tax=Daktulosphaira vitifoliae TaxID=58002 RepID=UPI0021AAACA1|nr:G2/mitotic-specific cyclin-B3 [Daktulosphaira vitifoliae]
MPPITRNQLRRNYQTEPYSKDSRHTEKRTALVDLVANNGSKKYVTRSESKKIEERVFNKNDNISNTKIEKKNKISQNKVDIIKSVVEKISETRLLNSKDVCSSSLDNSKDSTLYQSAVEESIDSKLQRKSDELFLSATESSLSSSTALVNSNSSELYESAIQEIVTSNKEVEEEEEIFEIDQTSWNNFVFVGCYARDIFKYLRNREEQFVITDYISDQSELTPRHRAIVVNWLVNLQENFGLNHEVLYMAVKLIDLYLIKNETPKDKFQLLASAALLLASKIDEREPGLPYDLVKQSRFIFTEDELFVTERTLFKALNFDINVPMSYCFLRRFARCMQVPMVMLTLARYILERCLMEYSFVTIKDSLKGASALYLAFQMCSKPLNHTEFYKYTGYYVHDIKGTVIALNNMLHTEHTGLTTIKQKYTHETFYKVARKPLLSNSKLQFD